MAQLLDPAPGTRTTETLAPIRDELLAALAEAGAPFDLAAAVPEPQDAPAISWGILGAGGIAGKFAHDVPRLSSGRIAAVGSRDASRAQALIDAHPGAGKGEEPRAHGSYEALLADPAVDAVYVATPHSLHREHALLALRAGKPVLVEKAFARSAAEGREILDEARAQGLFAMEAMWTRFLPSQVLLRHAAASGLLGEIRHVRGDHFQSIRHVPRMSDPALAGGALLDLGVYPVSFVHSLLGAPESIQVAGRLTERGVDLDETVLMGYPRATGVAAAGMDVRSGTSGEVDGVLGRVELEGGFYKPTRHTYVLRSSDGGEEQRWSWEDRGVGGGFQLEAAEAARCISAGRLESPLMPWRGTLEVLETMDEVRRRLGVVFPGE